MDRVLRKSGEQWERRSRLKGRGADLRWLIEKVAAGFGVEREDLESGIVVAQSREGPCGALLHGSAGAWVKLCFPCQGTQDKPLRGEQVDGAREAGVGSCRNPRNA